MPTKSQEHYARKQDFLLVQTKISTLLYKLKQIKYFIYLTPNLKINLIQI